MAESFDGDVYYRLAGDLGEDGVAEFGGEGCADAGGAVAKKGCCGDGEGC